MENNYVVYHCHSDLSNLTAGTKADCVTPFNLYIDRAAELGMKAISISEHGNMAHWLKKQEYAESKGLKYIHGMEAYITLTADPEKTKRDNFHLGMYAKNWDGMQELLKLSSRSFEGRAKDSDDKHFYFNPRITMEELKNTSDNIIITTACLGSPIWKLYKQSNEIGGSLMEKHTAKKAGQSLDEFVDFLAENRHRVFLEIQYHTHHEQLEYNHLLLNISQDYNIPLIAGTDTHALNQEYADARTILLKAKGASYGDEDSFDLTFPSYKELVERFENQGSLPRNVVAQAIENTLKFADLFEPFQPDRTNKYPRNHEEPQKLFMKLINEGFKKRGLSKLPQEQKQVYLDRIHSEYEVYVKTDTIDYMLLQKDVVDWAHGQGISTGTGRGSVTGSLIAFLLGITEMDSVKHKLNFFRFINPNRISLADIDIDFMSNRRDEVIEYLFHKEGVYVSEIITFSTLKVKGAVKEVGRALNMPLDKVQEIANLSEDETKIDGLRQVYPELFRYVDTLNGCIVAMGTHPSGYLVSPVPLDINVGTLWTKSSPHAVSQLNMKEVDSLNFVKLDILGTDNVWLINQTCQLAGIPYAQPYNTDLTDEKVWRSMAEDTLGVFQMESDSAAKMLSQLFDEETLAHIREQTGEINYLSLLSMANGAIRPSGASYRDALARGEFKDNGNPELNIFLKDTLGYMIFQEQIMRWLVEFCGYSEAESDSVRRAIGKKTGTEQLIPEIKAGFIKTMVEKYETDLDEATQLSESFLQVILDASNYSFSLNHSEAYSILGYLCAWLKYYYPVEFTTAMLNVQAAKNSKDIDGTPEVMQWAKKHNIRVNRISFGKSKGEYSLDKETGAIYKGVASASYLNNKVSDELYLLSKQINGNISFVELMKLMREETSIQSNQLEILIRLRYFDSFGEPNLLIALMYQFYEGKFKYSKTNGQSTKDKKMLKLIQMEEILRGMEFPATSLEDTLTFELDKLGYISTTYPEVPENLYFVIDIDEKYSPKIELYRLSDGETFKVKMAKKKFYVNIVDEDGDIETIAPVLYPFDTIRVVRTSSREAQYKDKATNTWMPTGKWDDWIEEIKVIRKSSLRKQII